MIANETRMNEKAAELRSAFDRSFSHTLHTDVTVVEKMLALRIGSNQYLVRLVQVSGLFAGKKITWLPSRVPELLGLAGLRGAVIPVYDFGMLLGCPRAAAPRWLLVTAGTPVGLAFDAFDGYLSVRLEAIIPEASAERRDRHVREVVRADDVVRLLVSLTSVVESIRKRASHRDSQRSDRR
jgi:chemotaxis signal transduction protein